MKPAIATSPSPSGVLFLNSRYQVAIKGPEHHTPFGKVFEMSLKRLDKEPIYDWRDIQRIKNELFGADATAVQVFPPEKHLVDTNQYYFYILPQYEFPFGFKERVLNNRAVVPNAVGGPSPSCQRPFDPEHTPPDLPERQAFFDGYVKSFSEFATRDPSILDKI
jgi:hypothetical protein